MYEIYAAYGQDTIVSISTTSGKLNVGTTLPSEKFEIEAPLIAKSRKAGHFVIVRVGEKGERMPLTIAGSDIKKGTITLVIQEVGLSSTRLCELNEGDYITDVVGPLGQATHIENFGTVVCAGGGVGVGWAFARRTMWFSWRIVCPAGRF